jgi:hypothetical protein
MSVLSSRNVNWRDAIDLYLSTINSWLHVVHPTLLAARLDSIPKSSNAEVVPQDPEFALLVLCMHLVTLYADSGRSQATDGQEMFGNAEYVIAKRLFGLARGFSPPSLVLVQCCILLAVFEFGHGDFARAYVSVGDAYTMAKFLGIRPGEYVEAERNNPVDPAEEERRSVYWSIFVLDRFVVPFPYPTNRSSDSTPYDITDSYTLKETSSGNPSTSRLTPQPTSSPPSTQYGTPPQTNSSPPQTATQPPFHPQSLSAPSNATANAQCFTPAP